MTDLYYLGEILETFNCPEEAYQYIELLCMAGEGYNQKDFVVRPALRLVS